MSDFLCRSKATSSENSKANRIETMKGPVDWKNLFGGSRRKIAKKLAKKKRKADEGG
jgi:hypothetical protein